MISVNGVPIARDAVAREIQHHPAETLEAAEREAATALVIRELLLQRVNERAIEGCDEDERIANLIALDVRIPEPTDEEIARYHRQNSLKFMTAPLYEAAHIFFPAAERDFQRRAQAKEKAQALLAEIQVDPSSFAKLALAHSACSSREQGGSLGQVTKGDTNPELERAMATMAEGSVAVVGSRHGIHILRLDRRVPGRQLPLEAAREQIAEHLRNGSRRRATAQYLQLLMAGAKISGIELQAADSPLVQ